MRRYIYSGSEGCLQPPFGLAQAAQAAAAAERSATKAASGVATLSVADDDGDDLDPNLYFERRLKTLDAAKAAGRWA
jgi:hypothetical protein